MICSNQPRCQNELTTNHERTVGICNDCHDQPDNPLDVQVAGNHYKNMKIQPVEFCQKNELNFCESSVIKYICRHRHKNGLEDLKKAKHFIELLMSLEYGDS